MSQAKKRSPRAPIRRRASTVFVAWSSIEDGRLRAEVIERASRHVLATLTGSKTWIDGFLDGFLPACESEVTP